MRYYPDTDSMDRMRKSDALAHFGTQQRLADAIGRVQSTVSEWGEAIPLEDAYILERLTERLAPSKRLKIDPNLYPRVQKILRERRA